MWFNSTIQPATRAQSPLTDLFNRVKSATTPSITLPEKETSTREVRAQTWRYVAKVEASNNGGSRDDERSKLLHDIKFPFLRGAWNAQPARQWPLIKFRIPRALSLPLCLPSFSLRSSLRSYANLSSLRPTVANLTLWLPDRSQDNHFCIGHWAHATNSPNALV